MKKNVFQYFIYAFTRLFSPKFGNIVGSSIIISFLMTVLLILGSFLYGYLLSSITPQEGISGNIFEYGRIGIWIFLVLILILTFLMRAWIGIIVPIRSIDGSSALHFREDWGLFKKYIGTYFFYTLWHNFWNIILLFGYPMMVILLSALHPGVGLGFGIIGAIGIVYIYTRLYLTWYHMLSEGSGKYKTFQEGIMLTRGKAWRIFWKVFTFALIITIGIILIDGGLMIILSLIGTNTLANEFALIIQTYKENLPSLTQEIRRLIGENGGTISLGSIFFSIFYALSSVLSRAMFHIFYVLYYLELREEYENESSFIRSSLALAPPTSEKYGK